MATIRPTSTLAFLFTVLTCQMLSPEGRLITQLNHNKSPTKNTLQKISAHHLHPITRDNNLPSSEPTIILQKKSCIGGKYDYPNVKSFNKEQTTLDCAPSTDHDKKDSSKTLNRRAALDKKYFPARSPTPIAFLSASAVSSKNDFRPTTTGLSSGARHSDVNKINKDESRTCLNDKCIGDFLPTTPSDSPGAGNAFANNNHSKESEQGMHLGMAHTQTGQKDDYQPTAPGHSPGAGHPILKKHKKAKFLIQ